MSKLSQYVHNISNFFQCNVKVTGLNMTHSKLLFYCSKQHVKQHLYWYKKPVKLSGIGIANKVIRVSRKSRFL